MLSEEKFIIIASIHPSFQPYPHLSEQILGWWGQPHSIPLLTLYLYPLELLPIVSAVLAPPTHRAPSQIQWVVLVVVVIWGSEAMVRE